MNLIYKIYKSTFSATLMQYLLGYNIRLSFFVKVKFRAKARFDLIIQSCQNQIGMQWIIYAQMYVYAIYIYTYTHTYIFVCIY